MFSNFFEKKDMERVIWLMLQSYKNIYSDTRYNSGEREKGNVVLEAGVFGALLYAKEKRISEIDFYEMLMQKINEYATQKGQISIEVMCYQAASLRGNFQKNIQHLGGFFGESARMLGLGVDVFEKHEIPNGPVLQLLSRTTLLRYLSAVNKS